jgi:outer membrane receptor protein involved in Fe transport
MSGSTVIFPLVFILAWPRVALAGAADIPLEEIVVRATLREQALAEVPASVAVLDAAAIHTASLQHFEELSALVPNLSWSGEGSRARYFQIRGAGELEQYEGAPNPSVGFIVDDIDVSGLGGIATTFDIDRIEVLRGPQGTRYGANALAGLIYLQSAAPGDVTEAYIESGAGSDGTWAVGAAVGGPVPGAGDDLGFRVSAQQYQGDGFRDNAYLGRDDTDGRDETTVRGRLRWTPGDWRVDMSGLFVDINNGYDAWSIDSGFDVYSDRPGDDTQRTRAGSARISGDLSKAVQLISITSVADSDIVFSYDADWGNADFWAPYVYDFTQRTDRERRTWSQELRLVSSSAGRLWGQGDWLIGAYALGLDESNDRLDHGLYDDPATPGADYPLDATLASDYDATSLALFGEFSWPLGEGTRLALGLRGERRDADYDDSAGNDFAPVDRMWGGEFTLTHELGAATTAYARIARGYKAGGFNPSLAGYDLSGSGLNITPQQVEYDPESLWNYEIGLRVEGDARRWWAEVSAFWQDRDDLQVRVPIQLAAGDPTTFIFLTDNAERGRALGVEAAFGWQLSERIELYANLGWLETELERFRAAPNFEGRDFPHAAPYSFAAGAEYRGGAGWFARLEVTGRGGFYFDYDRSTGNDRKADGAEVVSLRAGRDWRHWSVEGWVRNVFDEEFAVRGFYFGNEPPAFAPARYVRFGDPRHYGVTLRYRL